MDDAFDLADNIPSAAWPSKSGDENYLVDAIVKDFPALFEGHLDKVNDLEVRIEWLSDEPRIDAKQYSVPIALRQQVREEIDHLLQAGIIRPSRSQICSAAFAIPKRNGEIRLVMDYRPLNAHIRVPRHPIPKIAEIIKMFKGSKIYSNIDLISGYHQFPLREEDCYKTAFSLFCGQYEFTRLPFGIASAPAIFQGYLAGIMRQFDFVSVYVDDILIFSKNETEHNEHVRKVLAVLEEHGLTINAAKSHLFQTKVEYLGCEVSADGVRPAPSRVNPFSCMDPPTSKKQAQKFIGAVEFSGSSSHGSRRSQHR